MNPIILAVLAFCADLLLAMGVGRLLGGPRR